MKLRYKDVLKEVRIGDEVQTSRGDKGVITSITKPHKPGSTGRVGVKLESSFS